MWTIAPKLLALVMILTGVMLALIARSNHRTEKCPPVLSYNPKHWKPVWMQKEYFTPTGFRLWISGTMLISGGALLALLTSVLK
jgi:hypothetical protein